jgi:hypothetical protein
MRLGITGQLAETLCSTNPCESTIEVVRYTQRNVKRWREGEMRRRWTAAPASRAAEGATVVLPKAFGPGYRGHPSVTCDRSARWR